MITVELLGANYKFIFKHLVKFSENVSLGVSLEFSITYSLLIQYTNTYKICLANGNGNADLYWFFFFFL